MSILYILKEEVLNGKWINPEKQHLVFDVYGLGAAAILFDSD